MITETFAPVNFPVDGPDIGPMIIFKDVTLIYMRVNFLKWCEIGMAEVGASRQLYISSYYKKDVRKRDTLQPFDFCIDFFRGITRESAKSIVWLLMEVVTANKSKYEYQLEQKDILTLYERYSAVIDMGYDWQKTIKKRKQAKNPAASKTNKKKKQ
jgi:hypothetical protein